MGGRFGKYGDNKRKDRLRRFKSLGKAVFSLKVNRRRVRRRKKRGKG